MRPWSYVEWLGEEINRSRFHSSDAGWQDDRNFMYAPDIFKFGETVQVQLSCHSNANLLESFYLNILNSYYIFDNYSHFRDCSNLVAQQSAPQSLKTLIASIIISFAFLTSFFRK